MKVKDLTLRQLHCLRLAHSSAIDGQVVPTVVSSDFSGRCDSEEGRE